MFVLPVLSLLNPAIAGEKAFPDSSALPVRMSPPNPLVMFDGSPVTTPEAWLNLCRPELKGLFQHYMYGHLPPRPANMEYTVDRIDRKALGGKATLKEVTIRLGPANLPEIHLLVAVPNGHKPAPVFVGLNFNGNHTVLADPCIALPAIGSGGTGTQGKDAGRGKDVDVWAIEQSVDRGYAVATFYNAEVEPDRPDSTEGIRARLRSAEGSLYDWGTIAAWAWGLHRAVDYLVTDRDIDAKRIAVFGHSRNGKAALLAGAFDERIALVIPHQAGCGGTAPSRGKIGESVKAINDRFPHWFNAEFKRFNEQPERLPFDQHCLIAMVAPRPVLLSNAMEDQWANPSGQFEMLQAAEPVYRLINAGHLEAKEMPEPGRLVDSNLGFFIRPGKHSTTPEDWRTFLDFADRHLGKWQPLFDGKTLNGWKASDNPGSFKVIDGQIACDGPRAHLFYVGEDGNADYKNFELSVEALAKTRANSGVYFHTAFQEKGFPSKGFEVQVHNARWGEGAYRENKLTGSLYSIRNVYKPLVNDNEWFGLGITVKGKQIQIRVNDVLVVDYVEPAPGINDPNRPGRMLDHGTFALQCHDPNSKVFYRTLRVRRLADDLPDAPSAGSPGTDYDREIIRLGAANYPVVNYHVHLKGGLTLEEAMALSRQSGVFYGIAVNCGLNFPVTNDAGIYDYLRIMQGKPVFVGMQAEGREWVSMFSKEAIARFDYVFTDAMTIVDESGRRMRLWIKEEVPEIKDKQAFMDMLVDRTVKILSTEPVDIYVNPTYLPAAIAGEYDQLWTDARMKRVVDAAAKSRIAIEINSRLRLPGPAFLKLAKAAGCKFTFGTNNTDREIGRLDYCFQMVDELGLKWQDIWTPSRTHSLR